MHEEDRDVVYPPWMLQEATNPGLAEHLNEQAVQVFAHATEVFSPSQPLGSCTHNGSEVNAVMVHAVDPIFMSDDGRVIVIKRKGEPDKDKYAFPGGLLEPRNNSLGPIDIRETAAQELSEEVGLNVSYDKGEVIGERKIARHPRDIRIVSGVPAHFKNVEKYGVRPGDLKDCCT